jgi:hypothetical protein
MRPHHVITSIAGIAAVVGMAIGVVVQRQARLRLGEEHQALEQQLDLMTRLIATNARLSNIVARMTPPPVSLDEESRELLHLRGQVTMLRQQIGELEKVRDENRQAHAALERSVKTGTAATADYWPRDSWSFAGYATPDAALQSCLWAADNGDFKALAAGATGALRDLIEAQLAGKSGTETSIRTMDSVMGLRSVRILNREVQGDDTMVLTAELAGQADQHTGKLILKKVGNEWKLSALAQ